MGDRPPAASKRIWLFLSVGILIFGSAVLYRLGTKQNAIPTVERPSTDKVALSKFIELPITPIAAVWQILDPSRRRQEMGPSDWSLLAVMTFEPDGIALLAQSVPMAAGASLVSRHFQALLDPQMRDIVSAALPNPVLGSWRSGDVFFRPPLSHGYFVLVPNTNQVVLYLYTM